MDYEQELEQLRRRVRDLDHKAESSRWLLNQLRKKAAHFPRDVLRRLRKSIRKRRESRVALSDAAHSFAGGIHGSTPSSQESQSASLSTRVKRQLPVVVCDGQRDRLWGLIETQKDARDFFAGLESYKTSDLMRQQVASALRLDPNVGALQGTELHYLAPWHDMDYQELETALKRLPAGPFDAVIMVPFGKLGGADFVAGVLARAVSATGRTLILRTDASDWDRPDWYPADVPSVDLSDVFARLHNRPRALYALLQYMAPRRMYNVNSRLCFETWAIYGERLAMQFGLYAYHFCADHTPEGVDTGYPIWHFAGLIPHLQAALIDTAYLARVLTERYALPAELARRVRTVYTPAMTAQHEAAVVDAQVSSGATRARPRLLWAGRLDRQKRFDLVLRIAEAMPDVDFECWGKAVLDAPPAGGNLPRNVTLHPPFTSYDELPLSDSDGWLYTSAWDGLPTILIECAALGIPITASAVGGIPELIDDHTGWPVRSPDDPQAYVHALRDMLGDAPARIRKAEAAQARVRERHSQANYTATIGSV